MSKRAATSSIGGRLQVTRRRQRLTREELAARSGVSYAAIAQIETGRRTDIRLTTLSALADALALSVDQLIGRSPRRVRPSLEHRAFPYEADDEFLGGMLPFLTEGVEREEQLLAVTTKANIELLGEGLGPDAGAVVFVDAEDWYRSPEVALHRYREFVHDSIDAGFPWVRVIGEPVWHGLTAAEVEAWTRYEALINVALGSASATIICPYDKRSVAPEAVSDAHRTHPELTVGDGTVDSEQYLGGEALLLEPWP